MHIFCLALVLLPAFITCDEINTSCERPADLLGFEEACKTDPEVTGNSGTFLEQLEENIASVVEQTKRLINIAKKKLGIKYDEQTDDEPTKKCEYYQCILRKMEILGSNKYPNMTLMENWINEQIDDNSLKQSATMKMKSCYNALAINLDRGETDSPDVEPPNNPASGCDAALKLMMCLAMDEPCSMFKFP